MSFLCCINMTLISIPEALYSSSIILEKLDKDRMGSCINLNYKSLNDRVWGSFHLKGWSFLMIDIKEATIKVNFNTNCQHKLFIPCKLLTSLIVFGIGQSRMTLSFSHQLYLLFSQLQNQENCLCRHAVSIQLVMCKNI